MKKQLNVLITGVGGPTSRGFARSLKEYGKHAKYRVFGTDIHPFASGLYLSQLFERTVVTPKSSEPAYWEVTEKLIRDWAIDCAVVLPETEVAVWSLRQREGTLPCTALIPDYRAVTTMLDKASLATVLHPYGLSPKSIGIHRNQVDDKLRAQIEKALGYPFWVRSATGAGALGSYKIERFEDLRRWVGINPKITKFLASVFLPGRNLACKCLYSNGKLVRGAMGERLLYVNPNSAPSGISGHTGYGRLLNDPKAFAIGRKALELVFDATGAKRHGFFTVDMKEDAN